jgi:hypothetical protein
MPAVQPQSAASDNIRTIEEPSLIATFLPFDRWHALAGALLLLAVVSIRNAWDITLTMVRRRSKAD